MTEDDCVVMGSLKFAAIFTHSVIANTSRAEMFAKAADKAVKVFGVKRVVIRYVVLVIG